MLLQMFTSTIISLLLGSTLVSSAALKPRILFADEVLVYNSAGRIEIMNKTTYATLSTLSSRPSGPNPIINSYSNSTSHSKRCDQKRIIYENPPAYFQNWDVPMSSVVSAVNSPATVAVTAGYSISNSLTVSTGAELSLIENILSVSYSIDYSQSWSSEYSAQYTFEIPVGKYGAVVSNPTTTRHSGRVWKGCLGEEGTTSTYVGDSYESRAFGGLSWVDGVISLCTSDSFPLMRCVGEGRL